MVFSSTLFLFVFLPITLFGYYLVKEKFANYWLLFVSMLFFAWSQPHYLWIILLNILVNYSCALLIRDHPRARKYILALCVLTNLSILYYFKYFDFTLDSLNKLLGCQFTLRDIVLPIGISFFTFQGMSYVIDVYREDVKAQKDIFKVALYIVLFPQLIAGPIVRYKDIAQEIDDRAVTIDDFSSGIERFIIGLSKKAILANTLAVTADAIWGNGAGNNTWLTAWVGSIAYTLQIYFDFSGYSDMAIGLGRMFGFHFNENFNLPYTSQNITEFWRRWHISLSTWFRDYVYIPLGGNRKRVYLNLGIVFLLTGIWHGASWHFIAWGVWNGFFILLERLIRNRKKGPKKNMSVLGKAISKFYALLVIHFGWVLFRAPHTRDALLFVESMLGKMRFSGSGYTLFWYLDKWTITVLIVAVLAASSIPQRAGELLRQHLSERVWICLRYVSLLAMLCIAMLRIVSGTYNPFIYFQF